MIITRNGVEVEANNENPMPKNIISRTEYKALSKPSNSQAVLQLFYLLTCYLVTIFLFDKGIIFLFIITLIFTLHYTLNIAHECWHNILFNSNFLNKFFGTILSALVGMPYNFAKRIHFNHHKYLNKHNDPGYVYTKSELSKNEIIFSIFGILFLRNQIKNFYKVLSLIKSKFSSKKKIPHKSNALKNNGLTFVDLFYLLSIHTIILFFLTSKYNILCFILYEYAVLSLLPFVDAIRTLIDHKKNIEDDSNGYTRNFKIYFLDKILTKPYFDWHLLHHYFPQIPQHNLHKVEKIIISRINQENYFNSKVRNSLSALIESLRANNYNKKFT